MVLVAVLRKDVDQIIDLAEATGRLPGGERCRVPILVAGFMGPPAPAAAPQMPSGRLRSAPSGRRCPKTIIRIADRVLEHKEEDVHASSTATSGGLVIVRFRRGGFTARFGDII
jgi:hypothetical protein